MKSRGKLLVSILSIAAVLFSLLIPTLASDEVGNVQFKNSEDIETVVNFDKEIKYYEWEITKDADPESIYLDEGDFKDVEYTIQVNKKISDVVEYYSLSLENVFIENIGNKIVKDVPVSAVLEVKVEDEWEMLDEHELEFDVKNKDVLEVPFKTFEIVHDENHEAYRFLIKIGDEDLAFTINVDLEDVESPDETVLMDNEAVLNDFLNDAPEGLSWEIDDDDRFPMTLEDDATITYDVRIENNSINEEDHFELINTATLRLIDSDTRLTAKETLDIYTNDMTEQNSDPDEEEENGDVIENDEEDYPAAPAVANEILKEKGIDHRYLIEANKKNGKPAYGNYIAEVSKMMTSEAKFPDYESDGDWDGDSYVEKSEVEDYRTAVENFLKTLIPEED